ncbi:MAG: S-methyl-5'-thioinosine phosphorylase [Thiolinea sp.]
MDNVEFAVIGGSGLTEIEELEIIHREVVHTPYGEPSGQFTHGQLGDKHIIFLARHGYTHCIPPHKVNYRANIWALRSLGVSKIVAIAAVGGITGAMAPQKIVVPDQIIDYTSARAHTFFEEGLSSVTHIDFSQPYSEGLRQAMLTAGEKAGVELIDGGVYGATQGPRLETAAEIIRMERDGCDLVGMTAMPEACLAREAGIEYASYNVVANWAAGKGDSGITMDDIYRNLSGGMTQVKSLLKTLVC